MYSLLERFHGSLWGSSIALALADVDPRNGDRGDWQEIQRWQQLIPQVLLGHVRSIELRSREPNLSRLDWNVCAGLSWAVAGELGDRCSFYGQIGRAHV